MKTITKILIIVIALLINCEKNPVKDKKEVFIDGNSYVNEVVGFELTTPESWALQMDGEINGIDVSLIGTRVNYEYFNPSFSVIIVPHEGEVNINELTLQAKGEIANTSDNVNYINERIFTFNNYECYEIEYQLGMSGTNLILRQFCAAHDENIIIVTFTCLASQYNSIKPEFNDIQNSINLDIN